MRTHFPDFELHSFIVESNEALYSVIQIYLAKRGGTGDHFIVYIGFVCSVKSNRGSSFSDAKSQTFAVISSEQEARYFPVGSHLIAFTSVYILEKILQYGPYMTGSDLKMTSCRHRYASR